MKQYIVYMGDEPIGTGQIQKDGLYLIISANCKLSGQVPHRLIASWEDKELELGIFVPNRENYEMKTRIAAKKWGRGEPVFRVVPKHNRLPANFVPISIQEPFRWIDQLEKATFGVKDGISGVIIQSAGPQGNDQTQEFQSK